MKYFLMTLLALTLFLSAEAQVTIKENVARFFLEEAEKAKILSEQVVIKDARIRNLGNLLTTKDSIITTYKNDSVTYNNLIDLKQEQIKLKTEELKIANKEIRKQKVQKKLVMIGSVVVVILILI